jgi:hypothetical protein
MIAFLEFQTPILAVDYIIQSIKKINEKAK